MNTFNRKSLYAALAGLGALSGMGAAEAVNVSGEGVGQVLIYPYYTVRHTANGGGYNTLLSVINSTGSAKAVKVRFLEGKNSREVLDFNLFLSKNDVWTGTIVETVDGAAVTTTDQSCILPNSLTATGHEFVNYAFVGKADDGADQSLDRTREGYVEIIEMASYDSSTTTSINVTHVSGVPPGCADNSDSQASKDGSSPSGGLFGALTLINVLDGSAYSTDAVALDKFSDSKIYFNSGSIFPNLANASPNVSVVINNGEALVTSWAFSIDAVSATLMHNAVLNEYATDPSILANTDWVVTMPTKWAYVQAGTGSAFPPFQKNFNGNAGACDDIALKTWDREEKSPSTPGTFSPPPPTGKSPSLCWEANVITFESSGVLGSTNNKQISLATGQVHGWARLTFAGPTKLESARGTTRVSLGVGASTSSAPQATYFGLPVVGFAVQAYNNNVLVVGGKNVQSTYGADFVHRYQNSDVTLNFPAP